MNSGVLIIGGGVIGLAIAREFHKKGVSQITILERGNIGKDLDCRLFYKIFYTLANMIS